MNFQETCSHVFNYNLFDLKIIDFRKAIIFVHWLWFTRSSLCKMHVVQSINVSKQTEVLSFIVDVTNHNTSVPLDFRFAFGYTSG